MAGRPHKQELDYYSLYCNYFGRETAVYLNNLLPRIGPFLWLQLKAFIFDNSYYRKWDVLNKDMFMKHFNCSFTEQEVEHGLRVILSQTKLLNKKMFERYGILTSQDIQEQYLFATTRREYVVFYKEHMLFDIDTYQSVGYTVYIKDLEDNTLRVIDKKNKTDTGMAKKKKASSPKKKPRAKDIAAAEDKAAAPVSVALPPPVEPIQYQAPDEPAVPAPPAPAPPEAAVVKPVGWSWNQVMADIRKPYESRDSEFKATVTLDQYEQYVKLMKKVQDKYQNIWYSKHQLTPIQFADFHKIFKPSDTELEELLLRITANMVQPSSSIESKFNSMIMWVRKNPLAKNNTVNEANNSSSPPPIRWLKDE